MQSMKDLDDGRYNKVANVVGHTMQYHPHGDASIADAMVQIGQKDLLIDTQGNWGNILTGDRAAASRYIEARLSKFALEIVFNPKVTNWQASYDGRRKEPINLPVKFPLLLVQGAEGIAVGLSTKILPHNFIELAVASISYLKQKKFTLLPDFITGGIADFTNYNDGKRGGRVRIRAKISVMDKTTLLISEIPFGTTTTSLIDSILKANEKGKIKIKKIDDNTASNVEILVYIPNGISPDKTIDALYAFTNCEISISPLTCIIQDNKPVFLGVSDILKISADNTVKLLKKELKIKLGELEDQWHNASLERIFIENKIYRDIEEETTWEGVLSAIDQGLKPYIKKLKREVVDDDLIRLTEIKIKRISKFDSDKANEKILNLEAQIKEVKDHLDDVINYSIAYLQKLKKNYSKNRERKTEIRIFDDVDAKKVVIRNTKLYVNRVEGFVGTSMRKDEYVCDCSDIDDIVVFTENGKMIITKVDTKTFIGKNIIHVAVFKKKDKRTIYNMIYRDGDKGYCYLKRFPVHGITRDKPYSLIGSKKEGVVKYFSANPNGEAERVTINLRKNPKLKKLKWDVNFSDYMIKGRMIRGNQITKHNVKRIDLKEKGISTLNPRKIWFDDTVQRLNVDGRGDLLGEFRGEDKILVVLQDGSLKIIDPDMSTHFSDDMIVLEKWTPKKPLSVVYFDGKKQRFFVKRFLVENENKHEKFISDHKDSFLELISTDWKPVIEIVFNKIRNKTQKPNQVIELEQFISIKGVKAMGNQLSSEKIKQINTLEAIEYEPPVEMPADEIEVVDEKIIEDEDIGQTALF
jgi:topoisomerase-4 subunit A